MANMRTHITHGYSNSEPFTSKRDNFIEMNRPDLDELADGLEWLSENELLSKEQRELFYFAHKEMQRLPLA